MPMRYASDADVLASLKIKPDDTDAIERVTRVENGLADAFDAKIGRSFAATPAPAVTRTIRARSSEVLVIHEGVRTVSSVAIDGIWDGAVWGTETLLAGDEYILWPVDTDGTAYGIERIDGGLFTGSVRVTGVFADQADGTIPDDVREAMTLLTVKEYRRLTSSPSEQVGPDGQIISTPSGWNDPTVKAAIDAHTLTRVIV